MYMYLYCYQSIEYVHVSAHYYQSIEYYVSATAGLKTVCLCICVTCIKIFVVRHMASHAALDF